MTDAVEKTTGRPLTLKAAPSLLLGPAPEGAMHHGAPCPEGRSEDERAHGVGMRSAPSAVASTAPRRRAASVPNAPIDGRAMTARRACAVSC